MEQRNDLNVIEKLEKVTSIEQIKDSIILGRYLPVVSGFLA